MDSVMPKAGESIANPVTGERIVVLQSGQETAGELFAFELSLSPHGFVNAEHIHSKQEEAFEVTRGTVRFRINGQEMDAATGQKVVIPAGTRHVLWNSSDEEASMAVWLRPAMKTEVFFETFFGLARDGKTCWAIGQVIRSTVSPNQTQLGNGWQIHKEVRQR